MVSLSGTSWTSCNKELMMNKLKRLNKNVIMNASDSGGNVENGEIFLKGGTTEAF